TCSRRPLAVATTANGLREQVGETPLIVGVNVGDVVAIIDAADPTTGDPADLAYQGAVALTVGAPDTAARRALQMNCTVAGNVSVTLADSSTDTVPVAVGLNILPLAASEVNTSGTTATCTYFNLK
ncbi:MAG TPA: hypothetical protein VFC47_03950, partial [Caulobacteraceae bacterium]|nr:hypothetical protein [Caulobacteraceae bacterium]